MTTSPDLDELVTALTRDRTVDIVTRGRRSGLPRTTEIWTTLVDGQLYLCGTPGAVGTPGEPPRVRDWLRNLRTDPAVTVRLKERVRRDLEFRATEITDPEHRRRVFAAPAAAWYREQAGSVAALVAAAPLVELLPTADTAALAAELRARRAATVTG